MCPLLQAKWRGVFPRRSWASIWASYSNSNNTTCKTGMMSNIMRGEERRVWSGEKGRGRREGGGGKGGGGYVEGRRGGEERKLEGRGGYKEVCGGEERGRGEEAGGEGKV